MIKRGSADYTNSDESFLFFMTRSLQLWLFYISVSLSVFLTSFKFAISSIRFLFVCICLSLPSLFNFHLFHLLSLFLHYSSTNVNSNLISTAFHLFYLQSLFLSFTNFFDFDFIWIAFHLFYLLISLFLHPPILFILMSFEQLIHQLECRKYIAVDEERFDRARRLKDAISELLVMGPTLGALEIEKRRFVERQDYEGIANEDSKNNLLSVSHT